MSINKKKQTPLAVLQALEPFLSEKSNLYKLVESEEKLLLFKDIDTNSLFFFAVQSYEIKNSQLLLRINYSPSSKNSVGVRDNIIPSSDLKSFFSGWVTHLGLYDKIKTVYDDPILHKYEEELLADFQIVDNDAYETSFDLKGQIWIDNYLGNVLIKLEENKTEENKTEIEAIEGAVKELKEDQSNLPKKKVFEKLIKIWAKIRKFSIPLLKDTFISYHNEIKQLIERKDRLPS